MNEAALKELETLREQDRSLSEAVAALRRQQAAIDGLGRRAQAADAFLEEYPVEAAKRREVVEVAAAEIATRREAVAAAELALEGHHDDETFDRLDRAARRARERLLAAVSRHERAVAELERLEGDAAELPAELQQLAAEAQQFADIAPNDVAGLIDWASRAHAELFVAAGQLDREREQVIREANELASMLLGEPTHGSTVAQALARVEQQ